LLRKLLVALLLRHFSDSTKDFGDKIDEKTKLYSHTAEAFSPILAKKTKLNRKQQNSSRDLFFGILLLFILLFNSSCITKFIWSDKSYKEKIGQFYIGADGRYVVLIGTNYHYILSDNSGLLKEIFSLKQQGVLSIDLQKTHLKLDSNNDIEGDFVLRGPFTVLPEEDVAKLRFLGFSPDRSDDISIKIKLKGRRYVAKYLGEAVTKLGTNYVIQIYYSDSGLVKGVGKAAITPIAVLLDGALLIGKIVIYPLTLSD
jgi:hypothetical protein